jgi:hypothetical protein
VSKAKDYVTERDQYLTEVTGKSEGRRSKKQKSHPFFAALVKEASVATGLVRHDIAFKAEVFESPQAQAARVGGAMDNTLEMVNAVNAEVEESKRILQDLTNQVSSLRDSIGPALLDNAKAIRSSRMTVVSEVRQSLAALHDIRKFFLEDDYGVEMERLERFVHLCKELMAMKESGALDAICDSAIHLGLKGAE